jgi:broad-specificity NMP kinase
MIVMINGSFGVGKSTVASLLRKPLRGVISNPEWLGAPFVYMPLIMGPFWRGSDDYQDVSLWRRSVVWTTRLYRLVMKRTIIVPMTFSNKSYFEEITCGLKGFDADLRVFCLKADLSTIRHRLSSRGLSGSSAEWIDRRIQECSDAHNDEYFGESVDTERRTPAQVTQDIVDRITAR